MVTSSFFGREDISLMKPSIRLFVATESLLSRVKNGEITRLSGVPQA